MAPSSSPTLSSTVATLCLTEPDVGIVTVCLPVAPFAAKAPQSVTSSETLSGAAGAGSAAITNLALAPSTIGAPAVTLI